MIKRFKNPRAQFPKFTGINGLFRLKVFYQILFIIIVMILFLGIQAYMNVRIINTMQKTTKTLSGETTFRLHQISQLKQDVAKLQIAYLETLNNGNPASFNLNISLLEKSTVFLWLDAEDKKDIIEKLSTIKRLLKTTPNKTIYETLKNELLDLTLRINDIESQLSSSFVQGLVNNDRFLSESKMNGILIVIISSLFSLFLGIIIVNSISTPLQKLIELMNKVSEGNFAVRFNENRKDEFGVVMNGFNHMIGNIVEMQQSIKKYTDDLESKNIEMERFIYTVSHDLQSPLITIKGFAGSILRDIGNGRTERLASDVRRIEGAASKMQQFLKDLLELSRIGRIINASSAFSITEAAMEVIELLQGPIEKNGVKISMMKDMPVVRGDRQRILEVLQNLIENAIKFSGTVKRPQIEIGYINIENRPTFFVRDNGPGIDDAYHQKIFGLFDKLEPNSEGTGIGLAIVKRIIELHHGRIWVESSLGHGATFFFTVNERA
jgi:signal transduction histidine kinase